MLIPQLPSGRPGVGVRSCSLNLCADDGAAQRHDQRYIRGLHDDVVCYLRSTVTRRMRLREFESLRERERARERRPVFLSLSLSQSLSASEGEGKSPSSSLTPSLSLSLHPSIHSSLPSSVSPFLRPSLPPPPPLSPPPSLPPSLPLPFLSPTGSGETSVEFLLLLEIIAAYDFYVCLSLPLPPSHALPLFPAFLPLPPLLSPSLSFSLSPSFVSPSVSSPYHPLMRTHAQRAGRTAVWQSSMRSRIG